MTNYQSILPSSAFAIEDIPHYSHRDQRSLVQRRWYLFLPAFILGVLGFAAFFVLQDKNQDDMHIKTTDAPVVENDQADFPDILQVQQFELWDQWKQEMVHVAQEFSGDLRQAWKERSEAGAALRQWWGDEWEQAGQWWDNVANSTHEKVEEAWDRGKKDAKETGEWAQEEGSQMKEWMQDEEHKAANTAKSVKDWAGEKAQETGAWMKEEGNKTGHWVGEETKETGEWAEKKAQETGSFLKETENKTKERVQKEGEEAAKTAGGWFRREENATVNALEHGAEKTKEWAQKEEGTISDDAKTAEHWVSDEAHKTGDWIEDEAHKTGAWVRKEENATAHAVGHGAEKTKEWFQEETNETEHWVGDEARASANWFKKEENATAHWLKKEASTTRNFFKHEANVTKHWFQHDADAVSAWWFNLTHRKSIQDETLLYLNSTAAFTLLADGFGWYDFSRDFFTYQQGWDVQENQAYCGVASAAAVLNSLRGMVTLPVDPAYNPYPYATQDSLFNECTGKNVILRNTTFDGILASPGGLSLDQTAALLECNLPHSGWNVTARHVDPTVMTLEIMRKEFVMALMSPAARVMINYNRAAANQVGEGHFSPIGSYSHAKDAFLVMDVAKYRLPPVWIPATVLYRALSTVDGCGTWRYPDAQIKLSEVHPKLLHPKNPGEYVKAVEKLKCKAAHRGYIIVKQVEEA